MNFNPGAGTTQTGNRASEQVRTGSATPVVHRRFESGAALRQMVAFPAEPAKPGNGAAWAFQASAATHIFLELANGEVHVFRFARSGSEKTAGKPLRRHILPLPSGSHVAADELDILELGATLVFASGSLRVAQSIEALQIRTVEGHRVCYPHDRHSSPNHPGSPEVTVLEPVEIEGELSSMLGWRPESATTSGDGTAKPADEDPIRAFRERLDQEALRLCSEFGPFDAALYNYLSCAEPALRSRRLEAIRGFPIFADVFCKADEDNNRAVRMAVDRGKPLIDVLSWGLGTSRECVRYLAALRPEHFGQPDWSGDSMPAFGNWTSFSSEFVRSIGLLSPSQRPREPQDWRAFGTLHILLGWIGDEESGSLMRMLKRNLKDGWAALLRRIRSKYRSSNVLSGCRAYAGAIVCAVEQDLKIRMGEELLPGSGRVSEIVNRFIVAQGIWRLLERSDRWRLEFQREFSRRADADGWGANRGLDFPQREPVVVDNLAVVPLLTPLALIEEGMRMNHCVASYYSACQRYGRRIFSVRSLDGGSLSTFELEFVVDCDGAVEIVISQHHGPWNADPPKECIAAAASFVEMLSGKAREWNLQDVQIQAQEFRAREDEGGTGASEYDAIVTEARIAALQVVLPAKTIESLTDEVHRNFN